MQKATIKKALKRKPILALVVGAVVFSSAFGFAATLGVTSASLGAGNSAVTSCTATVNAAYGVAYDNTISGGGYRVNNVTVTGNLSGCSGRVLTVDLVGTGNASLTQVTHTITAGEAIAAGSIPMTVGGSINAANVTNVSAVIAG